MSAAEPALPATTSRPWWALVVAVVALAAAVWLIAGSTDTSGGMVLLDHDPQMLAVAPGGTIDFDELPEAHQVLYQEAHDHEDAFTQSRCYCGCEAMLGHEDLFRCFVTEAGEWERHGTGCAVCLAQAEDMRVGLADGVPVADIVAEMDARYGGITGS